MFYNISQEGEMEESPAEPKASTKADSNDLWSELDQEEESGSSESENDEDICRSDMFEEKSSSDGEEMSDCEEWESENEIKYVKLYFYN